MSGKYYVYVGGRWCEVETRLGRINGAGWRSKDTRAKFLVARGGRLHHVGAARVLKGLRALAEDRPGSVKDGPPLPAVKKYRRSSHHRCCRMHSRRRCDLNANEVKKPNSDKEPVPAVHSPVLPVRSVLRVPAVHTRKNEPIRKQNKFSSSSDVEEIKQVVKALIETNRITNKPKRRILNDNDVEKIIRVESSNESDIKSLSKSNKVNKKLNIESSDENAIKNAPKTIVASSESDVIRKPNKLKNSLTIRSESDSPIASKSAQLASSLLETDIKKVKSKKRVDSTEVDNFKELIIDESDVILIRRFLACNAPNINLKRFDKDIAYKAKIFYKLNPLVAVERCKYMENLLRQKSSLKEFARNLGLRSITDVTPEKRYKMRSLRKNEMVHIDSGTDKENITRPKRRVLWNKDKEVFNSFRSSVSDVRPKVIRPQTAKRTPKRQRDSTEDDSDNDYRSNVRKSAEKVIANMVDSSTDDDVNKGDNPVKRFTRSSMKDDSMVLRKRKLTDDNFDVATDNRGILGDKLNKDNVNKIGNAVSDSKKAKVKDASSSEGDFKKKSVKVKNVRSDRKGRDKDGNRPAVSERDKNINSKKKGSISLKPLKMKKSSVPNGREYTNLEDHAIVAWVSIGGREKLVNGNRVWKDLEEQYTRITGQNRSWHSLRNRYLRYILPSLGSRALDSALVARLRAAAATGEIKRRKQDRRNSIFSAPPVQSASAAVAKTLRAQTKQSSDSEGPSTSTPIPRSPSKSSPQKRTPIKPSPPKTSSISKLPSPSKRPTSNSTRPPSNSKEASLPSKRSSSNNKRRPSPSILPTSNSKRPPSNSKEVPLPTKRSSNSKRPPSPSILPTSNAKRPASNSKEAPLPSKRSSSNSKRPPSPSKSPPVSPKLTSSSKRPSTSPSYSAVTRAFASRLRSKKTNTPVRKSDRF